VDEEIGRGVDKLNRDKVRALAAYTFDGTVAGEYETETFSADLATVTCTGVNVHPGFAKGKLTNAVKMAAAFLELLPADRRSPETTAGHEQFVHPYVIEGGVPAVTIKILLRSFVTADLGDQAAYLRELAAQVEQRFPQGKVEVAVTAQYRNMKEELDRQPHVAAYAAEAIQRAGLTPHSEAIRGGTDGSRLTAEGLPTPNLFAGGLNFHSVREYVAVDTMKAAVRTGIELVQLWEERA
jgi:tripeptide aminopeptidase